MVKLYDMPKRIYRIREDKRKELADRRQWLMDLLLRVEEEMRKAEGCLYYHYAADIEGAHQLSLSEIWEKKEDRKAEEEVLTKELLEKIKQVRENYVDEIAIEEHQVYVPPRRLNDIRNHEVTLNAVVSVPGSKSMTNRALLLAALSEGEVVLEGVLFSDDSRHFLSCLAALGFELEINEKERQVRVRGEGGRIPFKEAVVDVGSAGTAARFITAMLALSDGRYTIQCSGQMERRPMQTLFEVLEKMGADFQYLHKEGHLPVIVTGSRYRQERQKCSGSLSMDISKSTQFLSAMLMVLPVGDLDIDIRITSEKKTGAYIDITMAMLKEFGIEAAFDGEEYHIRGGQRMNRARYVIEPDVSAACYFFAAAAMTGGSVTVRNVFSHSLQGDIRFLEVLKQIGCKVMQTQEGICVEGPKDGRYDGVEVDMNNFSDQALTLAAVAAFAGTDTIIRNISHIRGQECDRMSAIVNELGRCGIKASQTETDIVIHPGVVHGAVIETYDDHRVAMAFQLLSLRTEGIVIDNPMCCKKTFENYYEVFEEMLH